MTLFTSLTCGTTWHAAGLLGKLHSSTTETKLSNYSVELYSTLEEETGLGTGKIPIIAFNSEVIDFRVTGQSKVMASFVDLDKKSDNYWSSS